MPETTRPGRCPACGKPVTITIGFTDTGSVWSFARCPCGASTAQRGARLLRWECQPAEGVWDDGHAPVEVLR